MNTTVKFSGLKEIDAALGRLPKEVEGRFLQQSLRYGADSLLEDQKILVPVKTGDLKDTLAKQLMPKKRGIIGYLIGVRRNMPGSRKAHLIEFGTATHQIVSRIIGKPLGYGAAIFGMEVDIPAQPARSFVRAAMDGGGEDAIKITGVQLWKRINRYWKKNTKR